MTPALKISHLTKLYRRGTLAVDDLSLEVEPGDFFGFLGPNGAGKSTTINCITGIASPTSGTIEVFGVDTVKRYRDARRLIGMSPQEFNVDTFARVYDIIDWMGGYFGMKAAERHARVEMLIEKFDLVAHAKVAWIETPPGENASRTPMDLPIAKDVIAAVEGARGKTILLPTSGGTVPLDAMQRASGSPTISVPIANHDDNQHAANENLRLKNLWDGVETMAALMAMP